MTICSRCKKDIDPDNFLKNGKVLKTCNLCRDKKNIVKIGKITIKKELRTIIKFIGKKIKKKKK